jgi:hypothetical protein
MRMPLLFRVGGSPMRSSNMRKKKRLAAGEALETQSESKL